MFTTLPEKILRIIGSYYSEENWDESGYTLLYQLGLWTKYLDEFPEEIRKIVAEYISIVSSDDLILVTILDQDSASKIDTPRRMIISLPYSSEKLELALANSMWCTVIDIHQNRPDLFSQKQYINFFLASLQHEDYQLVLSVSENCLKFGFKIENEILDQCFRLLENLYVNLISDNQERWLINQLIVARRQSNFIIDKLFGKFFSQDRLTNVIKWARMVASLGWFEIFIKLSKLFHCHVYLEYFEIVMSYPELDNEFKRLATGNCMPCMLVDFICQAVPYSYDINRHLVILKELGLNNFIKVIQVDMQSGVPYQRAGPGCSISRISYQRYREITGED